MIFDCLKILKGWRKKTFETAGATCSTDERIYQGSCLGLEDCKEEAKEQRRDYPNANFIFFQSADDRVGQNTLGAWCHIYKSCEQTRVPSISGTNYEFVHEGMFQEANKTV